MRTSYPSTTPVTPGQLRQGGSTLNVGGTLTVGDQFHIGDIGLSIFSIRFRGHHPDAHDMQDLGWRIARHDRLMADWQAVLPNPILRVHLHEWVRNFDPTLRRVLDFLGLPYDANCARFHELDRAVRTASRHQVRESINAKGMSRGRDYADHLAPLVAGMASAT